MFRERERFTEASAAGYRRGWRRLEARAGEKGRAVGVITAPEDHPARAGKSVKSDCLSARSFLSLPTRVGRIVVDDLIGIHGLRRQIVAGFVHDVSDMGACVVQHLVAEGADFLVLARGTRGRIGYSLFGSEQRRALVVDLLQFGRDSVKCLLQRLAVCMRLLFLDPRSRNREQVYARCPVIEQLLKRGRAWFIWLVAPGSEPNLDELHEPYFSRLVAAVYRERDPRFKLSLFSGSGLKSPADTVIEPRYVR